MTPRQAEFQLKKARAQLKAIIDEADNQCGCDGLIVCHAHRVLIAAGVAGGPYDVTQTWEESDLYKVDP